MAAMKRYCMGTAIVYKEEPPIPGKNKPGPKKKAKKGQEKALADKKVDRKGTKKELKVTVKCSGVVIGNFAHPTIEQQQAASVRQATEAEAAWRKKTRAREASTGETRHA